MALSEEEIKFRKERYEKRKAYRAEYLRNNRDKTNARSKTYRNNNIVKIRESEKRYESTETRKEYRKNWLIANSERNAELAKQRNLKNKDKIKIVARIYLKNNPDVARLKEAKRRATKLQATPNWLTKEHLKEIKDIYKKATEMEKNTGIKYNIDHIIPLQGKTVCGLHVPWNLQILTEGQNKSKNNKLVIDGTI